MYHTSGLKIFKIVLPYITQYVVIISVNIQTMISAIFFCKLIFPLTVHSSYWLDNNAYLTE